MDADCWLNWGYPQLQQHSHNHIFALMICYRENTRNCFVHFTILKYFAHIIACLVVVVVVQATVHRLTLFQSLCSLYLRYVCVCGGSSFDEEATLMPPRRGTSVVQSWALPTLSLSRSLSSPSSSSGRRGQEYDDLREIREINADDKTNHFAPALFCLCQHLMSSANLELVRNFNQQRISEHAQVFFRNVAYK